MKIAVTQLDIKLGVQLTTLEFAERTAIANAKSALDLKLWNTALGYMADAKNARDQIDTLLTSY